MAIDPKWAWAPYTPGDKNPWDLRKVGHLYRRAAFGANWSELQEGLRAGPEAAVERLLTGGAGAEEDDRGTAKFSELIRRNNNDNQARAWWLYRMVNTRHPLREKITLLWHNHFATSNAKVQNVGYMLGQYDLMHRYALGNFRQMLVEMSEDPAMMVWLDTAQSKKGQPNENYARELMELFSLGIGNYTETDIREAAKAFTGWELRAGKAFFNKDQHDDTEKAVIGQKGKWQGRDIVRICLEQPACPYFVTGKLFRYLVSETVAPTKELLAPLAKQLRDGDFDIAPVVRTILRSN